MGIFWAKMKSDKYNVARMNMLLTDFSINIRSYEKR